MSSQRMIFKSLLCGGILSLTATMAFADAACDAEMASIKSELNSPTTLVSPTNLTQAKNLFKILSEDCAGGTPMNDVFPITQQIKSLLNMGES